GIRYKQRVMCKNGLTTKTIRIRYKQRAVCRKSLSIRIVSATFTSDKSALSGPLFNFDFHFSSFLNLLLRHLLYRQEFPGDATVQIPTVKITLSMDNYDVFSLGLCCFKLNFQHTSDTHNCVLSSVNKVIVS